MCAHVNRCSFVASIAALIPAFWCSVGAQPARAQQPDFRLQVVPGIVYKVDDPGGSRTSSFVFNIAVICSTDCDLTPMSARVELSSAGSAGCFLDHGTGIRRPVAALVVLGG